MLGVRTAAAELCQGPCLHHAGPNPRHLAHGTSRRLSCWAGPAGSEGAGEVSKSKQEMLARIQKAKQYREKPSSAASAQEPADARILPTNLQSASSATPGSTPPVLTTVLPASSSVQQPPAAKKVKDVSETGFSSFGEVPEEAGAYEEGRRFTEARTAAFARARKSGFSRTGDARSSEADSAVGPSGNDLDSLNGTAERAADFLRDAFSQDQQQQSANERPEIFTLLQEDRQKQMGADIVSVGQDYSAATAAAASTVAAEAADYTPKVSTWGRFPRPANISEAYGGGRTIRQGEALETEEAALARKQRIAEALSRYRQTSGFIVDSAVEAACQALFQEGEGLFKEGLLAAAATKYAESAAQMPLRTQLGGQARLQQAICLDSLGQGQEAHSIYRSLSRHPTSFVAKRANQMVFGFRSMDYLKTHTMSYSATAEQYAPYFTRMMSDYSSYYAGVPDGSTMEKDEVWPLIIAAAVMITPILLLAGLVVSR